MTRGRAAFRARLTVATALASAPHAAAVAQGPAPAEAVPLARMYCGEFRWRGDRKIDRVVYRFEPPGEPVRGESEVVGAGTYDAGDRVIALRLTARFRPADGGIEVRERTDPPGDPKYIVDGANRGWVATDGSTLVAVWTTRRTGDKGDLRMRACADGVPTS